MRLYDFLKAIFLNSIKNYTIIIIPKNLNYDFNRVIYILLYLNNYFTGEHVADGTVIIYILLYLNNYECETAGAIGNNYVFIFYYI